MYPRVVTIFLLTKLTEICIIVNSTGTIIKGNFLLFTHIKMFQSFYENTQFSLSHEKNHFPEKPDIDQEMEIYKIT